MHTLSRLHQLTLEPITNVWVLVSALVGVHAGALVCRPIVGTPPWGPHGLASSRGTSGSTTSQGTKGKAELPLRAAAAAEVWVFVSADLGLAMGLCTSKGHTRSLGPGGFERPQCLLIRRKSYLL